MKKYINVPFIKKELSVVTCDRCGKSDEDPMETQEFLYINFVGGFRSIFGDMNEVEGDFCQRCFKEVLGDYLRIKEDD